MRASVGVLVLLFFALHAFAESGVSIHDAPPPVAAAEWKSVYLQAIAASGQHDDEAARVLLEKCWQTAEKDEERGLAADGLGQTLRRLGRSKEAVEWLERAQQEFSKDPKQALRLAVAVGGLADIKRFAGDYHGAETLLGKVLGSELCDEQALGFIRNSLADLLREEGRGEEAQKLFRQTLDTRNVPARERIGALIGLADIDRSQGSWQASISEWNLALETSHERKDEVAEAIILRGLGETWLQSGSAAHAEPLLRHSLKLMEANAEAPAEEVASSHAGLAELYRAENKLALAEDEWAKALEIERPLLGEAHPQVAVLMEMLSDVYAARGEFTLARDYATRASRAMSDAFGENSMPAAAALTNQAAVEQRAGDPGTAAAYYEHAIAIAAAHPEYRAIRVTMMERYAGLLKAMHRTGEAKALLAQRNALR